MKGRLLPMARNETAGPKGGISFRIAVPNGFRTLVVLLALQPQFAPAQTFSSTSSLGTGRNGQRAVALNDGMVLITGGYDVNENALASSELFDPATGSFTGTGNLITARRNFGITLLDDGTVLITGGYDNAFNVLNSAEIYHPNTGTFTVTGNLSIPRADHTAARLSDGTVLIAGGFDNSGNALTSAELYVPSTGTFTSTGSLNNARGFATATDLMDGRVLVAGGWAANSALSSAELYDPASSAFTNTGSMNVVRVRNTATLLDGGNVLIAGGEDSVNNILASAELYSPTSGTFTLTGPLNVARGDHAATLLTNGTVLLEGGFACQPSNCAGSEVDMSPSAEIYDPVSATFGLTGSLSVARQVHTATLLNDGTILVTGGWSGTNPALTSAEVYRPGSFSPPNLVSISLSPLNPSLLVGSSQALVAVGTFSDNSTQTLTSLIWSSSDPAVATVTNNSGGNSGVLNDSANYGVLFGISAGTSTIAACAGSICGSTTVNVTSAGFGPGFSLSASPASATISAGEAAVYTLTLNPRNGFNQYVPLSCTGAPRGTKCTVSPAVLAASASGNSKASVTIRTISAWASLLPRNSNSDISHAAIFMLWPAMWTSAIAALFLGFFACRLAHRRRALGVGMLAILLVQLVACGGMDSQTMRTLPGTYHIVVTGSAGGLSNSVGFDLTVR